MTYTGRSDRRALTPTSTLPYAPLAGSAPAYVHAELLFLDHNYDWPVISGHRDLVVDAVYSSIIKQVEATSGIACAEPVTVRPAVAGGPRPAQATRQEQRPDLRHRPGQPLAGNFVRQRRSSP